MALTAASARQPHTRAGAAPVKVSNIPLSLKAISLEDRAANLMAKLKNKHAGVQGNGTKWSRDRATIELRPALRRHVCGGTAAAAAMPPHRR